MRTLLTSLLLAAAVLPTWGHAQGSFYICDRTPQVVNAIREHLPSRRDWDDSDERCHARCRGNLCAIGRLDLQELNVTTLKRRDFIGLVNLQTLDLSQNYLTSLPPGLLDDQGKLTTLNLNDNHLTALPEGLFDGLTSLETLNLSRNSLTDLPEGVFDFTRSLSLLRLTGNHLVGLSELDLVFDNLASDRKVYLSGQTEAPQLPGIDVAAVPLLVSATNSMRQGFLRIINETGVSGTVRIRAVDDGGNVASTVEIPLRGNRATHLNAGDLEDGNRNKGIPTGIGAPRQGDWRLGFETDLVGVRALAYVRTSDGFLTAMHDVLPRDAEGRLVAITFNPATNRTQASRLRLVNVGDDDEAVAIQGEADTGYTTGPVRLTLAAGEARTLSAQDLEDGAQGLTGTLGDGPGKWRLFISAGRSVLAMNLLESPAGHLTNISTMGVASDD